MECLTPSINFDIFTDNYFTSFRLLTLLGVNNIRAKRVLNKNRLRKFTIIGHKQLQKKERGHFKKQCNFDSQWLVRKTAGWFTQLHLNLVNLRDMFDVGAKLKENIFKNSNPISSTVTTRTWVLSTEWKRTWPSIDIQM